MTIRKAHLALLAAFALALAVPAAVFADEPVPAAPADDEPAVAENLDTSAKGEGKTMAEFVHEAKFGKDRKFTDEDAMLLMKVARILKESNKRSLGMKVERIAAKIANE